MADELKLLIQMTAENGTFKDTFTPGTVNIDQAAQGFNGPVVTVGTTYEVLPIGDVATEGFLIGQNLDTTNFVTMAASTGAGATQHPYQKAKAGEPFALRLDPTVTIRWKADTSVVNVQVKLYED